MFEKKSFREVIMTYVQDRIILIRNLATAVIIVFALTAGSQTLTVLSPNGGEEWLTNTSQTITWEFSGSPADLMIEYTLDDGNYWYYLAYVPSTDTTGSYSFQNYLSPSTQAKVRVSSYDDPSVSDESDDVFTVIESPVYFYTPWPGESYYRSAPMTISWYSTAIDTFSLEYTTDNGATWNQIVNGITADEYTWTTPDLLSDECLIKISNTHDPGQYGLSSVFSLIELPVVTLIAPNGGETWNYGEMRTITYSGTNLPSYMYLEYSDDGGQDWYYLGYAYGSDTGGATEVYVPYVLTDSARVKVSDPYAQEAVSDISDADFTIYVPPVIVYYPSQGQEFYNGSQTSLSWLATGIDSLNIELTTDGGQTWQMVEENLPAYPGYYYWTVSGTPSDNCQLRFSDASDPSKYGTSNTFVILETPVITITSPTGGDIWNTDTEYTVTWSYDNPGSYYVYIDYSLDGGQTWGYIGYVENSGNEGSYDWVTPEVSSDSCIFRVTDYAMGFVSDTSDYFTITHFPETPICIVTIDSVTNQNVIVWEKPASDLIQDFIIYKESDEANIYLPLGTVPYSDLSVFTDTNSNPAVKSYRYKLGFNDADGNVYPSGELHQTIHLSINKGVGDSWNLIWTDYMGFSFASYRIYRGNHPDSMNLITSISSSFNSYTDLDAPEGYVYYMVEVVHSSPCDPQSRSTGYSTSRSNIATNFSLGVDDPTVALETTVYPNPASSYIEIHTDIAEPVNVSLTISDLAGRTVMQESAPSNSLNSGHQISTGDLTAGPYLLRITSGNATAVRKIIIRH